MSQSLNDLVRRPPGEVLDWLRSAGYVDTPEAFNWLGLIEVATHEATKSDGQPGVRRAWAEVTLAALARAELIAGLAHQEVVLRHLNLAAAMLRRLGTESTELILDSDAVVRLFLSEVPFTASEVRSVAIRSGLPVELVRALRTLKNWLSPLTLVVSSVTEPTLRAAAEEWIALRPDLP